MRTALVTLLLLLPAVTLRADTPTTSAPDPVQPITRISFPCRPWVGKAVFSKDGESLFVHLPNNAINLWEVFTYHWPEALGGLLILTAIICCLAMARVARSKRIPGAPHCRKCNYCLLENTRERCPECNHPTKRPIKGRPQWLRLLPWSTALIALAAFYLCLWVINVPRTGWASNYFNLWSPKILEFAKKKNIAWLVARGIAVDEIVEYETMTGKQRRILFTQPLHMQLQWRTYCMCLTPDGKGVILPGYEHDALAVVSIETGRIVHRLECPEIPSRPKTRWTHIAGFDQSGETVYVDAIDEKSKEGVLVSWSWEQDKHAILFKSAAYERTYGAGQKSLEPRRFLKLPDRIGSQFLSLPGSRACGNAKEIDLTLIDFDVPAPSREKLTFSIGMWGFQDPLFSTDGNQVLIHAKSPNELTYFDLSTGQRDNSVQLPGWCSLNLNYAIDRNSNKLILQAFHNPPPSGFLDAFKDRPDQNLFVVQDTDTRDWIGRYVAPTRWMPSYLITSPDGRYFASQGFTGVMQKGMYLHELLIYDLQSLPHTVDFVPWPDGMEAAFEKRDKNLKEYERKVARRKERARKKREKQTTQPDRPVTTTSSPSPND
jgi:hypothetical protein